jgi:hypothetical protein
MGCKVVYLPVSNVFGVEKYGMEWINWFLIGFLL